MSADSGSAGGTAGATGRRKGSEEYAPRRWIYENLTPWRIHACFTENGELLARKQPDAPCMEGGLLGKDGDTPIDAAEAGTSRSVVQVLSIPALGEVTIPREDAAKLNTLKMRRLGQIEVRPGPSELLSNLPRAIVIFGWMAVVLVFGAWALFAGGGSAVPWAAVVAAVVAVPVVALIVATGREIHLYNRFSRYRTALSEEQGDAAQRADGRNGANGQRSLEGVERGSRVRSFVDGVPRHAAEVVVLVAAVTVSVIGLGVAIHLTTQLNDLLSVDYGALVKLDNPFQDVSDLARRSPAFWQLLVGHVAQWILVSVAALTPAAMYFQFDRQRLASVQRRWVQEVFRLDPTVRTVRDIEAKYGSQIESSFGDLGPDSGLRLGGGRRSPVIVATILLAVGWFLIISATQVPDLIEVPADNVTAEAPGDEATELVWPPGAASDPAGDDGSDVVTASDGGPFPVSAFFHPELTLVGYAFLGAYVFTLFHVIRGYQRRDLHPKTYNTVVVRILAAYALALVVSVVYDGPAAEVLLFFVGFMPESALVWLREKFSGGTGPWKMIPLHEPAPLTDLEGIDLYDRTRLAEEGINNIEALAHADIVDLMSSTRISAAQLVDWTDQAILYLRVGGDATAQSGHGHRKQLLHSPAQTARQQAAEVATSPAVASNGDQPDVAAQGAPAVSDAHASSESTSTPCTPPNVFRNLYHLRTYGIRTATDLMQVYEQALRRGEDRAKREHGDSHTAPPEQVVAEYQAIEVEALRAALDLPDAPQVGGVRAIQTITDTLSDEEWFVQVRNWRYPEFGAVDAWYWYLDGHDWRLTRVEPLPERVEQAKRPFTSLPMAKGAPATSEEHDPNPPPPTAEPAEEPAADTPPPPAEPAEEPAAETPPPPAEPAEEPTAGTPPPPAERAGERAAEPAADTPTPEPDPAEPTAGNGDTSPPTDKAPLTDTPDELPQPTGD